MASAVAGGVEQVSAAEAIRAAAGGALLLDVREQHEWDDGHAPTARHIPMSTFGERVGELPVDERMLVICRSGARSQRVAIALLAAGFEAANVAGGMEAWQSAGGVVVAGGSDAPRA